ncbi:MAG: MBL fold metallo-hydrolase [Desulfurococcales archaeon]|nr:MBL fold metallo-hydrolase [Desulfurococcales archaeon]
MDRLKLMLLGGGGSYPPPGYSGPCLLIRGSQGENLLVDPGEGCLSKLTLEGIHPCEIRLVYISHKHIDHWAGLPAIAVGRVVEGCPWITIHAPHAGEENEAPYTSFLPSGIRGQLEIITEKTVTLGSLRINPFRTSHPVPTYGFIVEDRATGRNIAYTADTGPRGWDWDILEGIDALVAEATLPSTIAGDVEDEVGHMSVRSLLNLVGYVRPEKAVAFHLSPYSLKELVLSREAHSKILFGDRVIVEV